MMFGDDEVMHHAGIGCLEAVEPRHHAGCIDGSEGKRRRQRSCGVVAEEHHLAVDGIDLRMRGERSGDAAVIVAIAAPVQRAGLDLGRQVAFLQREQASAVKNDVGIGDAAVLGNRGGRIGQFSAEATEQARGRRRARPAISACGPSGCGNWRGRFRGGRRAACRRRRTSARREPRIADWDRCDKACR